MGRGIFREAVVIAELVLKRFKLFPFVMYFYNLFYGKIQKVPVFLIRGLVKNTNYSVTTLFIGCEESAYQLAFLAYSKIEKIVSLGKILSCQIDPSRLPKVEIIAVYVRKPLLGKFLERGYLLLPYVSFRLDLRQSIGHIMKRSSRRRRRDIKKLKSFNYSYTICRDKKDFDFFYRKMYLPYITKRFKRAAKFNTYLGLNAFYTRTGRILFVKKGGKPIVGILFKMSGETLHAFRFGVYEGDYNHIKDLAGQAALFFLIDWAKMNGMKSLDYGSTLPFFNDGIFSYKREWGMFIENHFNRFFCALKLNNPNKGSLAFLRQNPFIFVDKGGEMNGIILVNHRPTKVELQQIFSRYYLPKLNSLIVIAYHSSNTRVIDETEFSTRIQTPVVKSTPDIFLSLQTRGFNVETHTFTNQKNAAYME